MQIEQNFIFLRDATTASESKPLNNLVSDYLILDISGTSSNFIAEVYGQVDYNGEFKKLALVNRASGTTATNITAKGIYQLDIYGLTNVKVKLVSISGGTFTAFGKAVSIH